MKKIKNCKHCHEPFQARRSNNIYCTPSCKTKACYERNDYKYVSGHYKKQNDKLEDNEKLIIPDTLTLQMQSLEDKLESLKENIKSTINGAEIANSAIGSVAADAAIYGFKKVIAPNTLPATKQDVDSLIKEINNLKVLVKMTNFKH